MVEKKVKVDGWEAYDLSVVIAEFNKASKALQEARSKHSIPDGSNFGINRETQEIVYSVEEDKEE